jgi:hypothetical protein
MRRFLNPIVLAGCAWLGTASLASAQTDFNWNGQLAPGQSIEIRGVNGEVHASAARGGDVVVTAVRSPGRRGNPADVRFEVVPYPGGVTVCAVYPAPSGEPANECRAGGRGSNNVRDNDTRVDFMVQVPAGIGFIGQTVNGSVDAQDLQGDATGTTVNGSVNISTTGSARATTVNGSINASMGRAVWPNGAKFTTVNGGVTVRLPAALNADVRLSTVTGGIQSEFPLNIATDPGPKHAEGVLGAGGQRLDVTTVNGSISLLRR